MPDTEQNIAGLLAQDQTVGRFVRLLDSVWDDILEEFAAGLSRPSSAEAQNVLTIINRLLRDIDTSPKGLVGQWIQEQTGRAFVLGDRDAARGLKAELAKNAKSTSPVKTGFGVINKTQLRAQVAGMQALTKGVQEDIRRELGFMIRRTQLTLQKNEAIRDITTKGVIRGKTGQRIADDLASMILGKKVDPAVKKRLREIGFRGDDFERFERIARGTVIRVGSKRMSVRAYSNLVARTQLREAHTLGTIVRLQQNNIDHVRISRHRQSEIDECTPYAGKVFYIGPLAKDPLGFRPLREIPNGGPPFHPNCRHVALEYVVPLKSESEIEERVASSKAIPRRFLGKGASEIRKLVSELDRSELRKFFNEGFEDNIRGQADPIGRGLAVA
jgi:hypothetical protein